MSLRRLKTLIAVADTGSFQAAADQIFITQAAVSIQIKNLEDDLQVMLFDRSKRPPILNGTGRYFVEQARDLVARYDTLCRSVSSKDDLHGTLQLGAIKGVTTSILPPALAGLRKRHPRLNIRVISGLSLDLGQRVIQGELDCAIITEPSPPDPDLTLLGISEEPLVIVASNDVKESITRDDLTTSPFIRFNRHTGIGHIIDRALNIDGITVRDTMEFDEIEPILMMVSEGLGISIVPQGSLTKRLKDRVSTTPFGNLTRRIGLAVRRSDEKTPLIQALHRALVQARERQIP